MIPGRVFIENNMNKDDSSCPIHCVRVSAYITPLPKPFIPFTFHSRHLHQF